MSWMTAGPAILFLWSPMGSHRGMEARSVIIPAGAVNTHPTEKYLGIILSVS
jgi:hypothetical protein